ncbi:MAG: DUF2577 family protein [Eubacteriales bacterium]|nr:DUF2577 family protein [Eubacteriales bacterium]
MGAEKLISIMQRANQLPVQNLTDLVFGEVISIEPLLIKVDNRFTIGIDFLILSQCVKAVTIAVTIGDHSGTIALSRDLIIGDKVRMLRINQGQSFYVLERED